MGKSRYGKYGGLDRRDCSVERVTHPEFGQVEASIANFIRTYGDPTTFEDSLSYLKRRYEGRHLKRWVPEIKEIFRWAKQDAQRYRDNDPNDPTINVTKIAFKISQRKRTPDHIRRIFRQALPEIAAEYDAWIAEGKRP